MTVPRPAATKDPTRQPILATDTLGIDKDAWSTISSATVSATPQRHAAPRNCRTEIPSGARAIRDRMASHDASVIPRGLPNTSPRTTPPRMRVAPSLVRSSLSFTPVAENAKSGSTTYALHGASTLSMRSAGDRSRSLAADRLRLAQSHTASWSARSVSLLLFARAFCRSFNSLSELLEGGERVRRLREQWAGIRLGLGRQEHREQHPGERRVHAGVVEREPQDGRDEGIWPSDVHAPSIQDEEAEDRHDAAAEPDDLDRVREEDRENQH